jgi:hypothetical protein
MKWVAFYQTTPRDMRQHVIWEGSAPVRHSSQSNTHQDLHVDILEELFPLSSTETNWLLTVHCALLFILKSVNVCIYTAIFFLPYFYSPNAVNPHSTPCECQINLTHPQLTFQALLSSERWGLWASGTSLCGNSSKRESSHSWCAWDLGRPSAQQRIPLRYNQREGSPRGRAHVHFPSFQFVFLLYA